MTPPAPRTVSRRRLQERQIVDAVRALFDEQGLRDPSIEVISRQVGINKATIYRHVASKDELLLLVQCSYQDELNKLYRDLDEIADPMERIEQFARRYVGFCQRYPAYLDCATSLMRSSYAELSEHVSPAILLRLSQAIAEVNTRFTRALTDGQDQGVFDLGGRDPDHVTALAYSMTLGAMHLVRFGMSSRAGQGGFPDVFLLDSDTTVEMLIDVLRATLGVPRHGR